MIYENEKTKNVSFPVGGIGSGCISLLGNGEISDFEVFGRPNKNTLNGYTSFAVKASYEGESVAKILHGDTNESYMGAHTDLHHVGFGFGPRLYSMAGFPHFRNVCFDGQFPVAHLTFEDGKFPGRVTLHAFNPFIPHDDENSSLPAAFFLLEIENTSDKEIEYSLCLNLQNPAECSRNEAITTKEGKGIFFVNADKNKNEIGYSDFCILTDGEEVVSQEYWFRGGWKDAVTMFWNNFSSKYRMPERHFDEAGKKDHGSVVSYVKVAPGEKKSVRFILAWNVPNMYNSWAPYKDESGIDISWKHYYATLFEDSLATAKYALTRFDELYEKTLAFTKALHGAPLPSYVTDAISANLSVLKSPTVLRLTDGSLWGWEGCSENVGSCEGSCQHVWNYAYALPYLFPRLERSLRENTMRYALKENGMTAFRIPLPVGRDTYNVRACLDGQMGEVIKCYREWKISGDTDWLATHAKDIFKMLDYAHSPANPDRWDRDKDGVLEGRQHHTLDMELFGPSAWLEGLYLLALDCGAKMADALGETERAKDYRVLYEKGKKWTNENLFNGAWFAQKVNLKDKALLESFEDAMGYWNAESEEIKYQVDGGCIIDQMLSDFHAHLIGADGIFDKEKKDIALDSLFGHNFKSSFREVANMWRYFALNDEAGTMICSYPEGTKKPAIPVPYCEECMTGFEYALAALMIAEGKTAKGEKMVAAIRDRFGGEKRNPFNEFECGSNYARSMASFALLPIYSGFTYDMTEGYIGFSPITRQSGSYLFSVAQSYGTFTLDEDACSLSLLGAPITLSSFGLPKGKRAESVTADGKPLSVTQRDNRLYFDRTTVKESIVIKTVTE